MVLMAATGCKKEKTDTTAVFSISPDEVELRTGQEEYLCAYLDEHIVASKDVKWSSGNPNLVSISADGIMKASSVNQGNTVITARYKEKEATCKVKVIVPVQQFGFFSPYDLSKSLAVGEEFSWSVIYMPVTATYNEVTFENSDPSVADLTQDPNNQQQFTVKAKMLGTTTITARCGGKEAELFIYVDAVKASKVTVSPTSVNLECWESKHLTATVEPSDATNKKVSWSSSNPELVEVSNEGAIRGRRAGTATIYACCGDQVASCTVTVAMPEGAVDLGVSVYWAECNLGASSPFDYGDYYAWGEIAPKDLYIWDNYKYLEKAGKYVKSFGAVDYVFSRYGKKDDKWSFCDYDYQDDAARQQLERLWRIPTEEQFIELVKNCEVVAESDGFRFYSKVPGYIGQSIYFPRSGWMDRATQWQFQGYMYVGSFYPIDYLYDQPGIEAMFWTSELSSSAYSSCFAILWPRPEDVAGIESLNVPHGWIYHLQRYFGLPIRPVW